MTVLPRNTILQGDALARLRELPSGSVDCVVTSPPYYSLRDFGVDGQIGLEPTVEDWVGALRPVMNELARVLKPTGSLWLNLADTYAQRRQVGVSPKGLFLAPERMLLALAADGWIVRNKVIWAKTNPMPSVAPDRLSATFDFVYFCVRSARAYYFDRDAVREPTPDGDGNTFGRDVGDVWRIPAAQFRGPHFATFPRLIAERPILATCPPRICGACNAPWRTSMRIRRTGQAVRFVRDPYVRRHPVRYRVLRSDPRLVPGCRCHAPTRPGIVLDPFFGAGTVGLVAEALGRDWLGIELNPDYVRLANDRIARAAARVA